MKKILFLILIINFIFQTNLFADDLRNVTFSQKIESTRNGVVFDGRTFIKDGMVRLEYKTGDMDSISVIKSRNIYSYFPKIKAGKRELMVTEPYELVDPKIFQSKEMLYEFLNNMQAKEIGKETIDSKNCIIYEYVDLRTEINNKLWVWEHYGIPIKRQVSEPGIDNIVTISYYDIEVDVEIDSTLFDIPGDIVWEGE